MDIQVEMLIDVDGDSDGFRFAIEVEDDWRNDKAGREYIYDLVRNHSVLNIESVLDVDGDEIEEVQ